MFKKNILPAITKIALTASLLYIPVVVCAQQDTAYVIADTLPDEPPPPQETVNTVEEKVYDTVTEVTADENQYQYGTQYFAEKWQYEADTFFQQRSIPADHLKQLKDGDDFWYANSAAEKEKKPEVKTEKKLDPEYVPVGKRNWFQSLLWIIIIAVFVAAIMWYLMSSNVGLFSRKDVATGADSGEELTMEDIFAINYQKELQKAESAGNYRLAIRLMFLRLLKVMSEKNIIRYQQDKTNFDYLLQLHSTGYYNNFFRITRNYEYSWYGQFDVTEDAYRLVKSDFSQFDQQLIKN